ncbi:MAG: hypothetical protein KAI55_02905 [Candidatus Aenigmarchaeota archaeon]|nr:hypothetical protein [Candidatus Aenigmarchaeota archaeon]
MELEQQNQNTNDDVTFEVIKSEEIEFGTRGDFIEVARKKAITKDGENEFISLSRGYVADEKKRFRKGKTISFPMNTDVVEKILDSLKKVTS